MIILLSGFKHSGKDTFAELLIKKIPKDKTYEIVALADKLKKTVCDAFGVDYKYAYDQEFKEVPCELIMTEDTSRKILNTFGSDNNDLILKHVGKKFPTVRVALQYVGTEVLRDLSQDIHCEELDKDIIRNKKDITIITDSRFINEMNYFQDKYLNTRAFFVKRDKVIPENTPDLHKSEKEMFDVIKLEGIRLIENNSSLDELKTKAQEVAKELLWQK
jgi:CBS-domain-containing membrane protein